MINYINKLIIYFILLFSINTSISSISFAADWEYIGYGKINNTDIFYIFLNNTEAADKNNTFSFNQKHIFSKVQSTENGDKYVSVEFVRSINCSDKIIINKKAIFRNIDGNATNIYEQQKDEPQTITDEKSVNQKIFNSFCK